MFFNSWMFLLRTLVVGALSYTTLVILLRVSGKRTLSKMNAFDLVVTVALGSTLASALTSRDVSYSEAALAIILLVGLQYFVAWASVHSERFSRMVKSEPSLLFHNGRFLHRAMRRERVIEGEVRSAIRGQGIAALDEVHAVVLETDGTFTVLKKAAQHEDSVLKDVQKPDGESSGEKSAIRPVSR